MKLENFLNLLAIDSTSGKEDRLAEYLAYAFATARSQIRLMDVGDGTRNLFLTWGEPKLVFCTHLDTVPPFIPPTAQPLPDGDILIRGRGACDAKGQIFAMYQACLELEEEGYTDYGLLLVSGEETGSHGAKQVNNQMDGGEYLIVGEPTDNRMVSASKGTKAYGITITGRSAHSGYPEHGISAVSRFVEFVNRLTAVRFPEDPLLGPTTWNIGCLESPNPQNILSDRLTFRLYFRTTFASDETVVRTLENFRNEYTDIQAYGGDTPSRYFVPDGFETTTVAFGNDAPHIRNFRQKMLCGPGSILVAHTDSESILLSELRRATDQYKQVYRQLVNAKA